MPSGYTTPALGLVVPNHGDFATTGWDSAMDPMLSQLDVAYGQQLTIPVAGSNVVLTTAQASYPVLAVTGSLTNNVIIAYPPNVAGRRIIIPYCTMNNFYLFVRGNNGVDQSGVYFWSGFGVPYGIVVTPSQVFWDYGSVGPGMIMDMPTTFPGNGWLPCDGRYVGRLAHIILYDAIGATYGPNIGTPPADSFKLPDFRGAVLAMADNLGTVPAAGPFAQNAGNAGRLYGWAVFGGTPPWGEAVHALSIAEMPSHTHPDTTGHGHTATQVKHNHTIPFDLVNPSPGGLTPGGAAFSLASGQVTGDAQPAISVTPNTVTVNNVGGNVVHNNVQPTVATMKMIKW